jgi:hypothetical protein
MSKITISQISGGTISGVTRSQHQTIPNLIHYLEEGPGDGFAQAYKKVFGSPFPSAVVWYTDSTMRRMIVEKQIVRNSINMPITITWTVYSTDGVTPVHTVSDSITYSENIFETSRQRTIT